MVADFPDPASLPGGAKRGQASDMSTYYNLWRVAENVIERCVQGRGEMGWQATGMEQSLSRPSITLTTSWSWLTLLSCFFDRNRLSL